MRSTRFAHLICRPVALRVILFLALELYGRRCGSALSNTLTLVVVVDVVVVVVRLEDSLSKLASRVRSFARKKHSAQ